MSVLRQAAAVALTGYMVVLLGVLLNPSPSAPSAAVARVSALLSDLGLPGRLSSATAVEVGLNVAIFVPVGLLALVVWERLSWRDATAYGYLFTCAVELVQGVALANRSATASDVAANTLGTLLGAGAVSLLRGLVRARSSAG